MVQSGLVHHGGDGIGGTSLGNDLERSGQGWSSLVPLKAPPPVENAAARSLNHRAVPRLSTVLPSSASSLARRPRWSPLLLFCGPRKLLLHSQPRISWPYAHIKPGVGLVKRREEVIWYEQRWMGKGADPLRKMISSANSFIYFQIFILYWSIAN